MTERQQYLANVANDTLSRFDEIYKNAKKASEANATASAGFLATGNTFNTPTIIQNQVDGIHDARAAARKIAEEPAIARVVISDENGAERTLFINRVASVNATAGVIGYRSPMGRIASVPAGEEIAIPAPSGTRTYFVLERALLQPRSVKGAWDSVNSSVEQDGRKPITVSSFRALLPTLPKATTVNILESLLAEERASQNIKEGIRRSVITKMALRDRPILDKIQDEIFRLPLNSRLLVLGPPGSGKTTTLIRRLGQKLDVAVLEGQERTLLDRHLTAGHLQHDQSWLMFTPAELLKQYVKEAFAREGIAASDQRIKTWTDYSRDLARNTFRILKSGAGRGSFILREKEAFVLEATIDDQIGWFEDFEAWQDSDFWGDLEKEADNLAKSSDADAARVGARLVAALSASASKSIAEKFIAIAAIRPEVHALVTAKRDAARSKIEAAINLQVNRDKTLPDQIAKQLETLSDVPDAVDDLDSGEDEEEAPVSRSGRLAAVAALNAALRAQARVEATKRRLSPDSRNARLLEWLGDRSLAVEDRLAVGENIQVEVSARRFLAPVRRHIDGISGRYRRYRRLRQDDQRWYRTDEIEPSRISPLELDLILLGVVRMGGALLREARIHRDLENPTFAALSPIRDLFRNQILVDEATDFSPVQLACMEALCSPEFRSFFACGDFNQRITEWGVRSEEEFSWAVSGLGIRLMATTYRHSKQLNAFAGDLVRISGGISRAILPRDVDAEGVSPALGTNLRTPGEIAAWLAQRIREVEQIAEVMPSIAVLVNSEAEVNMMAEVLNATLADQNIRAVACSNGQAIGQGTDVRVFDVQHIKGLEFEAVFFIGVDRFAEQNPKLFDKYLYVGATRAATYLGMTCEGGGLPPALVPLTDRFERRWFS